MTAPKPPFTYFLDHALGKSVGEALRQKGKIVKFLKEEFPINTPDIDWLPQVSQKGWIILTKDQNIGKRMIELQAVANSNARIFTLSSGNLNSQEMIAVFINAIDKCEAIIQQQNPPFIAKIYKNSSVKVWRNANTMEQNLTPPPNS